MTRSSTQVAAVGDAVLWLTAALGVLALVIPAVRAVVAAPYAIAVALTLLLTWRGLRTGVARTCAGMLVAGAIACWATGTDWSAVAQGVLTMGTIFSFVAAVRLVELPMLSRGYHLAAAAAVLSLFRG